MTFIGSKLSYTVFKSLKRFVNAHDITLKYLKGLKKKNKHLQLSKLLKLGWKLPPESRI